MKYTVFKQINISDLLMDRPTSELKNRFDCFFLKGMGFAITEHLCWFVLTMDILKAKYFVILCICCYITECAPVENYLNDKTSDRFLSRLGCSDSYDDGHLQIHCEDSKVDSIIPELPIDTVVLEVRRCDSISLDQPLFSRLFHLKVLRLINCFIQNVSSDAFKGLNNLHTIDLSENHISELPTNLFENASNIEKVVLSSNEISDLENVAPALAILSNLKTLSVSKNAGIKRLQRTHFTPLHSTSLEELDISSCKISHVERDIFEDLKLLKSLDISRNPLTDKGLKNVTFALKTRVIENLHLKGLIELDGFPSDALKELKNTIILNLDLSYNSFEKLPANAIRHNRLKQLNMKSCKISTISDKAFSGVTELETINLRQNSLISIGKELQWLPKLRIMDLSERNPFVDERFLIEDNSLENLTNLVRFVLNKVPIRQGKITENMFSGLENLEILELSNSKVTEIADFAFRHMSKLDLLDLSNNELKLIRSGMFLNLTGLTHLYLKNNKISAINFEENGNALISPFAYMPQLEIVNLDGNRIEELSPGLWSAQKKLQILSIQDNLLRFWTQPLFPQNCGIEHLLLGHNKISEVTEQMIEDFNELRNLRNLDLSNNPYDCNSCHMLEFGTWSQNTNVTLVNLNGRNAYACSSPKELRGKHIEIVMKPSYQLPDCHTTNIETTTLYNFIGGRIGESKNFSLWAGLAAATIILVLFISFIFSVMVFTRIRRQKRENKLHSATALHL